MPKKNNKSIEEEILENRKTKKEEQENIEVDIVKPKLKHRVFSFNKTFDNLKIKYKKDPKKFIVLAASILVAFSLVIGSSYAYLTYISKTNSITTIEAGTLALNFKNETNSISLNNALPIKDEEGLEGEEEYEFTIENTGSLPASYVITLDNTCVAGKSYTIDGTSINADICIPINYIKVGLKEGSSDYKVLEYNENESQYIIDAGSLNSNDTKTYKMKLWLDYDTPNDYNSHGTLDVIFSAKLGLSYEQGVQEQLSASETLIAKVGTGGLEEITHNADNTLQIGSTSNITEYRYRGASPDNYVSFNNETWRIIGVFPTDDGNDNIENRIKIIQSENTFTDKWNINWSNDWSNSSIKDSILSTYETLDANYKSLVDPVKYYLGGSTSLEITAKQAYDAERKISGIDYYYQSNPNSSIEYAGLLYLSDYAYAASTNCTVNLSQYSNNTSCKDENWLFKGIWEWFITHNPSDSEGVYRVTEYGVISSYNAYNGNYVYRPVVYLNPNVQITEGTGTSSDPYILGI